MGILTYLKIAAAAGIFAAGLYAAHLYYGPKVATLKVQVAEQSKAIEYYEKAAKIDKETADVHQEIKQAVESNDIDRVRELYQRLRQHQRSKNSPAAPSGDGGTD